MSRKRAIRASAARRRKLEKLYGMRVKVVDVLPGDTMVLETEDHLSQSQIERVKEVFERGIPGLKCMLLSGGLRLAAVLRADIPNV